MPCVSSMSYNTNLKTTPWLNLTKFMFRAHFSQNKLLSLNLGAEFAKATETVALVLSQARCKVIFQHQPQQSFYYYSPFHERKSKVGMYGQKGMRTIDNIRNSDWTLQEKFILALTISGIQPEYYFKKSSFQHRFIFLFS